MEKTTLSDDFLPFALPVIEEEEISEVLDVLKSAWITTGPKVKLFEREFARYIGCKHAIAVNSCTAALHLALEAIGIREGDEIITSPMTFAATGEVIRYFKARPIFVDIDSKTMNLDMGLLENIVKRRCESENKRKLRAIIPVHYAGYPCDMDALMALASRYDLRIIEDAAHAFPTSYKRKMIGTLGDITCFSFYATKNITTGEGGMITTENEEYADRMRIMSLHGISKDAWKRYTAEGSWYYEIIAPGYKYNLTDIAAGLGVAQLKKADAFLTRRIQIADRYHEAFQELNELDLPLTYEGEEGTTHSWHLYVIRLNLQRLQIDRNKFIDELRRKGIGTSVHFIPLHIHPYYRETYGYQSDDFPVAYETYQRIISLPIYAKMTDQDVNRVIESVTDIVKSNRR
ncbi:MAG: UDP-4-amino-4,6-dideoxy-N-acetyl-beta-L-altrosamine transaminase [Deltaproteobacteria bacterium RBG_16_47_11]|nr:MAG: UDP-4-amino-4,6-dideoxy-N-acetyl-beta-L-altrosamine transaminase [Deltaproteobacteria bacterium RBG_16_47_11]